MRISDWSSDVCSSDLVNDWVRAAGIKGLRVDSNTRDLLARAKVVGTGYGDEAALESGLSAAQRDARDMPNLGFAADPRDTATPRAMDDLLAAIRLGRVLRPQTTDRKSTRLNSSH